MAHDLKGLETRVRRLQDSIARLHNARHADMLIPITHRGGWTTVVEFGLVSAIVDNMETQLAGLQQSFETVVALADMIGKN